MLLLNGIPRSNERSLKKKLKAGIMKIKSPKKLMKNLLQSLFKRTKTEDPKKSLLVRNYKDNNGHIYYRFRDPREMPGPRLRVAELAAVEADLSISAEDGKKLIGMAIEKFETATRSKKFDGFSQGLYYLVELQRRFDALAEEKTLQKLATVYFTMDDEDPETYINSWQQRKMDAWDADPDCKSFFLCRAAEITQFFGDTSDTDILTYLKKEQPSLEKVTDFLSKRTYNPTSEK